MAWPSQVGRHTYVAGERIYLTFCKTTGIELVPTTECVLTLFITHLATSNVSLKTIKVYLAAIRHMHMCIKGFTITKSPTQNHHYNHRIIPWLLLVLRGIKKHQAGKHFTKPCLLIIIPILYKIKMVLSKEAPLYDNTTFLAMCYNAFFGFLWVSEFTIPTGGSYDPSCHLSLRDVAVDNRKSPSTAIFPKAVEN